MAKNSGVVAQHLLSQRDEVVDVILELPDLAARAAAIARRVHDDSVIAAAAADLTLHKLGAVVHNPAAGAVCQLAGGSVLPRPGDHALAGVHMGDGRARGQACQRCAARVAEQVQHADGTASLPYLFLVPCPVHGLLRENAGVLEARGADDQRQIVPVDLPFLRQLFVVIPLPAALGRAVIDSVGLGPQRAGLVVFPDDLRVGTDQQGLAPALQPVVVGSVQQLIILPCISRAHRRFSFAICVGSMNFVVKAKRQSPSGLVNSASPSDPGPSVAPRHLPTLWGVPHFVGRLSRGQCPRKSLPSQGRWASEAKPGRALPVSLFKTYSSGRNPRRQSASARPCAGAHRPGGSRSGHGACGSACPSASGTARRCPPG